MIFSELKKCLFCDFLLYVKKYDSFDCFCCPNEASHKPNCIWGYYDDEFNLNVFNIIIDGYQLCYSLSRNTTIVFDSIKRYKVIKLDYLLEFSKLTKEEINRKIKLLLMFQ